MAINLDDPNGFVEVAPPLRFPYQPPQLIILTPLDIENNPGFSSDAGLSVSGS